LVSSRTFFFFFFLSKFENIPEFQRFRYYSYIIAAEKNSTTVTFHDHLRERGLLFYPPYYANYSVTILQWSGIPKFHTVYLDIGWKMEYPEINY
jgi:hypothetical protein